MLRDKAAASWLKIAADYDELAEGAAAAAKLGERKREPPAGWPSPISLLMRR